MAWRGPAGRWLTVRKPRPQSGLARSLAEQVDQRGTGQSNALNCDIDEDEIINATDEVVLRETRRCLEALRKHADVAFYTTSIAVRDLDRVREALGYETINLYGASYGTRVAQHYLRRFPHRTRSVILDGVVPPQLPLGPSLTP